MKKLLSLTLALGLLSGCSSFEPDVYEAADERAQHREEIRQSVGCQFVDDHAAYRKCVLSTYESSKPKTFSVTTASNGEPVAVVSNGELKPTNPALLAKTTETQTTAMEMVPVQPVSTCTSLPGMVGPCTYQTQEMYEVQLPAQPCVAPCAPIAEAPKVVTVSTTETVTEKPIEVVPMPAPEPEKTWWETYQETQPEKKPTLVCPCEDPNDPCPQCVTK